MTIITRNPFHCHGYIIKGEHDKVLVVDPGSAFNLFLPKVQALNPSSVVITYTHGHLDHIAYGQALRNALEAEGIAVTSYAPQADRHYFGSAGQQTFEGSIAYFHLENHYQGASVPTIDHFLKEGDTIAFDDFTFMLTPGHSPGSSLLISASREIVFSGDVLFADGGMGRTDFEGGSPPDMLMSISNIFASVSPSFTFFPGHGASFVLESERKYHHDLLKD